MYSISVKEHVEKIFRRLEKRDKKQLKILGKKLQQIAENPQHFKPLRAPMQNKRRAHIGSFILIYSINEKNTTIIVEDYTHHDEAYV